MFENVIDVLKEHFGRTIVYKGNGSLSHSFTGIFDETFTYVDPESGERISSDQISILVKLSDLPEVPEYENEFQVDSTIYQVKTVEKDGKGAARIFLKEKDQ